MKSKDIDLVDWFENIKENEDRIFVRKKDSSGKYGAFALSECEPRIWAEYIVQWLRRGVSPVIVSGEVENEI